MILTVGCIKTAMLPSGALRVCVYAGTDPVSKRRHYLTGERGPVAQCPAQLGDLRLQGVAPGACRVGPEILDEARGTHRAPGVEREPHQQFGGQPARDQHGDTVAPRLDAPEHRDGEHASELRRVSPSSAPHQEWP